LLDCKGLVLSLALTLLAPVALAGSPKNEAKAHFKAGISLLKAEKYEAAAAELEESLNLYPTKSALFNLANVYKVLSRYDDSLALLDRLERDHASNLDQEMKDALETMRTEMEGLAALLDVRVDPPGAKIFLDDVEIGTSPLDGPLRVDPGSRKIRATKEGFAPLEKEVKLVSRSTSVIELAMEELPAGEEPPEEAAGSAGLEDGSGDASDDAKPLGPALFWSGIGATVIFGGVALGMDLAVRADKDDIGSRAALDRNENMQTTGIVFLGLAGAAAITTAILAGFTDFGGDDESPALEVGAAPNGLIVQGRF